MLRSETSELTTTHKLTENLIENVVLSQGKGHLAQLITTKTNMMFCNILTYDALYATRPPYLRHSKIGG
ncbi:hypothetical protein CWE15_10870 [Aliidiomarina taiwanensis]|uniref:Uncharacterized protein n=1 Tax=Aliidiomarina taiwanensis TaxID=946228 RepID=A0A432WW80_9GAMM|nr:hypothetical protein CWE15_10870 [Aliidiomarina taiwanensis]